MRTFGPIVGVSLVLLTTSPARGTDTVLDPVVVTAPAPEAVSRNAPVAETLLPREELQAAVVETTADLSTRAPNLVVLPGGDRRSSFVQIRGFQNTPLATESVGLYMDGIPLTDQRAAMIPLFDVEAVEVLRGPQNLRFGRNADAGAINVVTRRPGDRLAARASVLFGNYGTQTYEASADGPLGSDRVRFSIAGIESRRDGYIDNVFLHESLDERNLLAGRGKLVLDPLPGLELELTGEAQHADEGSRALVLLNRADPFTVAYNTPGAEITDAYLGAMRATYTTAVARVTTLTARRSFDGTHGSFDADFSPRNELVYVDQHEFVDWTQEVRIGSPDPDATLRWEGGAFYEHADTRPGTKFVAESTRYVQTPPPAGLGLPFTAPVSDVQRAQFRNTTASGFGEVTVALPLHVEVTAGLRYRADRQTMHRSHSLVAPTQHIRIDRFRFDVDTESSAWLPEVTLAERPCERLLLYGTAARGYRPGGFSYVVDDLAQARFGRQRDWSGELGAKASSDVWHLTGEAALFWVASRDFQVNQRSGLSSFTIVNADRVTSRGVELSAAVFPLRELAIRASVGYTDARYDHFQLPAGSDVDGNRLQLVPPYNFVTAVEYTHRTGVGARIEYQGLGSYGFTEADTVGQDAFQLLNVRLGWQGAHFGLAVFAQNLTDETYFTFPIPGGPGGSFIVVPGAPRTFGLTASARF